MDEILKKLKRKFTLSLAIVASCFMFFIFIGFFLLLFGSTEIASQQVIEDGLKDFNYDNTKNNGNQVILISMKGDTILDILGDTERYGNSQTQQKILDTAIEKGSGRFNEGDFRFKVGSRETEEGIVRYVIYDRTKDLYILATAGMFEFFVYIGAVAFIILLSRVFAKYSVKPVQEAFSRQRDLVANASHELKTPITIISTNISVIKSEPNSTVEENQKWIDSIDAQLIRMNGLVTSMLNLSKMEHDSPKLEYLDFSSVVEGAALNFEAVCFEKDVKLYTEITPNIHVLGEFAPLERVVTILLDNAIKYCGENGKIACKLTQENKRTKLVVLNTGQSISKEEAEHVFDRFYRADGARKNPDNQSFGLGLAIAYATVSAHGGKINCRGVEGKGTIFEVMLPLAKDPNKKFDFKKICKKK